MSLFIETICHCNDNYERLPLHQKRMDRTRNDLFHRKDSIELQAVLQIPDPLKGQWVKCRVIYGEEIESIEYELYHPRKVASLKLVYDDTIDYRYKNADRSALSRLFEQRKGCDDVLIVKQGLITDASYANVAFLRDGQWFTPAEPLLYGTRLESYLVDGTITPVIIHPRDLSRFSEARLINAMLSLENSTPISIEKIAF